MAAHPLGQRENRSSVSQRRFRRGRRNVPQNNRLTGSEQVQAAQSLKNRNQFNESHEFDTGAPEFSQPDRIPQEEQNQYAQQLQNEKKKSLQRSLIGGSSPVSTEKKESSKGEAQEKKKESNGYISRRIAELRKHKQEIYEKAGVRSSIHKSKIVRQYQNLRNIIRVVKALSLAGSSFGDVFFSLWVFLLVSNGDMVRSVFTGGTPMPFWEVLLTLMLDAFIGIVILCLFVLLVAMVKFQQDPLYFIT